MTASTRITVAALAQIVLANQAANDAKFDKLLGLIAGQHATPAAVAEVTVPAKKATAKKATKTAKVEVAAPVKAKVEMPEALKKGFAVLRDTKDAISPLNKALDWKGANAGVKATDRPVSEIKAALAKVAAEQGTEVAKAAHEAYKVRLAAAKARASK